VTTELLSPHSVCLQLAALGDVDQEIYLDTLYAYKADVDYVGTFVPATSDEIRSAANALSDHVPLSALLERVLDARYRLDLHSFVDQIVRHCVTHATLDDPVGALEVIIDAALTVPPLATTGFIVYVSPGVSRVTVREGYESDALGRLSVSDFVALYETDTGGRFSVAEALLRRSDYLRQRIEAHTEIDLSARATGFARAIAPEWQGTLDDLLDTARALSHGPDAPATRSTRRDSFAVHDLSIAE
jgi:hypothetical protein